MNSYEKLIVSAEKYHISVVEKLFKSNAKGLCKGNKIAIRKDIPTIEKTTILAEELGHFFTTAGNILDLKITANQKQEQRARLWAYNKQIGLLGIVAAYKHGCKSLYEMAEYLDITTEFLNHAICCYRGKYGEQVRLDNYIIYFEPNLGVAELL